MNILPEEQKNNYLKGLKIRFFIVLSILLSFGFVVSSILLVPSYFASSIELRDVLVQSEYIDGGIDSSIQEFVNLPEDIKSKLDFISSRNSEKSPVHFINLVLSKRSSGIYIDSIFSTNLRNGDKIKISGLTISGVAKDRKSLVDFSKSLEEEKSFSRVEIPVSSLTKESNLPFSIDISIAK